MVCEEEIKVRNMTKLRYHNEIRARRRVMSLKGPSNDYASWVVDAYWRDRLPDETLAAGGAPSMTPPVRTVVLPPS